MRDYRFWAVFGMGAVLLVAVLVFLLRPVSPPPNEAAGRIAAAVDMAGATCLSDLSETKTKTVQVGISMALKNVGSTGTVTEQQIRSSVNLAIDQNLLVKEREDVRDCMDKTVSKYLSAQGLMTSPTSGTVPRPQRDPQRDAELHAELVQVQNDINTWDAAIFQNKLDIQVEKTKAANYRVQNRPYMADASEKNVRMLMDALATRQDELGKSTERRREIEALLR